MNVIIKYIFKPVANFLLSPVKRSILLVCILALLALAEFLYLGLARRTFVFYTLNEGIIIVEDRMLKHAQSREDDIIRYVEETLLGPVSPDLLPLFPSGTRLISLMYRDGVVFANLTPDAAMPPAEGGITIENFRTLYASILRNFSYVSDIRFFIDGNIVYSDEFRQKDTQDVTIDFKREVEI